VVSTPLFAGFPGFGTKLWMADLGGAYRGLYEWDGTALAQAYAERLAKILQPLSVSGSVRYWIIPDARLDVYLATLRRGAHRPAAVSA
jgi:hypothetical protein